MVIWTRYSRPSSSAWKIILSTVAEISELLFENRPCHLFKYFNVWNSCLSAVLYQCFFLFFCFFVFLFLFVLFVFFCLRSETFFLNLNGGLKFFLKFFFFWNSMEVWNFFLNFFFFSNLMEVWSKAFIKQTSALKFATWITYAKIIKSRDTLFKTNLHIFSTSSCSLNIVGKVQCF